jgi:hypothetical protein
VFVLLGLLLSSAAGIAVAARLARRERSAGRVTHEWSSRALSVAAVFPHGAVACWVLAYGRDWPAPLTAVPALASAVAAVLARRRSGPPSATVAMGFGWIALLAWLPAFGVGVVFAPGSILQTLAWSRRGD